MVGVGGIEGVFILTAPHTGGDRQIDGGSGHTVLLRSDGTAVACGCNLDRQCLIPALDGGLAYVQVDAGCCHTTLLRSDGMAVAVWLSLTSSTALH